MIQQTSLEAYQDLQAELGKRQRRVFNAYKRYGDSTDMEIVARGGFNDANQVRPRRFELVRIGLMEEKYKRICQVSKKMAIVWGVKT